MGLDMYLILSNDGEEIGYWRKANHIHKWFIDNCAGGDMEKTADGVVVTTEHLKELRKVILKVLKYRFKDKDICERLLPTSSGFFWGGIRYDEYYIEQCERTLDIIEKVLKIYSDIDQVFDNKKLIYYASW